MQFRLSQDKYDITHLNTRYPWGCVNTMDSISCKNANLKNISVAVVVERVRPALTSGCNYIVARQLQPRCVRWIQSVWTRRKCVAKQQLESVCRSIRRRATQLHRKAVVAIRRPTIPLITIYNRVVKFQSALHLIRLYRLSSWESHEP